MVAMRLPWIASEKSFPWIEGWWQAEVDFGSVLCDQEKPKCPDFDVSWIKYN